jgi:hypothetical protein
VETIIKICGLPRWGGQRPAGDLKEKGCRQPRQRMTDVILKSRYRSFLRSRSHSVHSHSSTRPWRQPAPSLPSLPSPPPSPLRPSRPDPRKSNGIWISVGTCAKAGMLSETYTHLRTEVGHLAQLLLDGGRRALIWTPPTSNCASSLRTRSQSSSPSCRSA